MFTLRTVLVPYHIVTAIVTSWTLKWSQNNTSNAEVRYRTVQMTASIYSHVNGA